jgi:hypothetical protein
LLKESSNQKWSSNEVVPCSSQAKCLRFLKCAWFAVVHVVSRLTSISRPFPGRLGLHSRSLPPEVQRSEVQLLVMSTLD